METFREFVARKLFYPGPKKVDEFIDKTCGMVGELKANINKCITREQHIYADAYNQAISDVQALLRGGKT